MGNSYIKHLKMENRNLIEENNGLKAEIERVSRYEHMYKEIKEIWERKFENQEESFRNSIQEKNNLIALHVENIEVLKARLLDYSEKLITILSQPKGRESYGGGSI